MISIVQYVKICGFIGLHGRLWRWFGKSMACNPGRKIAEVFENFRANRMTASQTRLMVAEIHALVDIESVQEIVLRHRPTNWLNNKMAEKCAPSLIEFYRCGRGFSKSLSVVLLCFGLLFCEVLHAALTITISSNPGSMGALVTLDGSFTAIASSLQSVETPAVIFPTASGLRYITLGSVAAPPTSSPFFSSQILGDGDVSTHASWATVVYGEGEPIFIHNIIYTSEGFFGLLFEGVKYISINPGGEIIFSGAFELEFANGDSFADRFIAGEYFGITDEAPYRVIVTEIPEPTTLSILAGGFIVVSVIRRRRRISPLSINAE